MSVPSVGYSTWRISPSKFLGSPSSCWTRRSGAQHRPMQLGPAFEQSVPIGIFPGAPRCLLLYPALP